MISRPFEAKMNNVQIFIKQSAVCFLRCFQCHLKKYSDSIFIHENAF